MVYIRNSNIISNETSKEVLLIEKLVEELILELAKVLQIEQLVEELVEVANQTFNLERTA